MTRPFTAIDPDSSEPPFEQLRAQLIAAVRSGEATAGDKLPTVRALASELGLAANTVAKAYRALESDGLIQTRGRSGSFVASHGDATQQAAQDAASAFASRMRDLRVDADDALAYAKAALGLRD